MYSIRTPVLFALLGAAVPALIAIHAMAFSGMTTFGWSLSAGGLPSAANGALHACALVGALAPRAPLRRAVSFVLTAAAMSFAVPWLAILTIATIGVLAFPMASAVGATAYALLIRQLWLRQLAWGATVVIGFSCVAATSIVVVLARHMAAWVDIWLTVAWWAAFSLALVSLTPKTVVALTIVGGGRDA